MQQAIAIAAAAGIASALIFGALVPGAMLFAPLILLAPAPLLIAGIGWHPLLAALGGLLGALAISGAVGSKMGLSFALLVGLPAYLIAAGLLRLIGSMPPNVSVAAIGRVFGAYILGGIALYSAIAMLAGALAISTDYAVYEGRLLTLFQRMMADTKTTGGAGVDAASANTLGRMFVRAFVPMSAIIIASSLITSLWLALRYLRRAERIPFPLIPASAINLPKETVFWLVGALGVAQASGFLGLFGASLAGTILLILMLNGLALVHVKTQGSPARPLILWAVWLSLFFFAPAALLYSFAGLLDALFDFRGQRNDPNAS